MSKRTFIALATVMALSAVTLAPTTADAHHSGGFWHQNWRHFRHFVSHNVLPRKCIGLVPAGYNKVIQARVCY